MPSVRPVAFAQSFPVIGRHHDHRIVQGAESGSFLRLVDSLLQGEQRFYEGVAESLGIRSLEMGVRVVPPPTPNSQFPTPDTVAAAYALVRAHRNFGHLAARLDPLGGEPPGDPP